ncbi:MAG: hypothetical protein NVSMB46_02460 [Candidatus Saccharimonadales bacterium]
MNELNVSAEIIDTLFATRTLLIENTIRQIGKRGLDSVQESTFSPSSYYDFESLKNYANAVAEKGLKYVNSHPGNYKIAPTFQQLPDFKDDIETNLVSQITTIIQDESVERHNAWILMGEKLLPEINHKIPVPSIEDTSIERSTQRLVKLHKPTSSNTTMTKDEVTYISYKVLQNAMPLQFHQEVDEIISSKSLKMNRMTKILRYLGRITR